MRWRTISELTKFINDIMTHSVRKDNERILRDCNFTERQEQIFLMKYIEKKRIMEIAEILGYSESMINKELKIVRKKIDKIWQ